MVWVALKSATHSLNCNSNIIQMIIKPSLSRKLPGLSTGKTSSPGSRMQQASMIWICWSRLLYKVRKRTLLSSSSSMNSIPKLRILRRRYSRCKVRLIETLPRVARIHKNVRGSKSCRRNWIKRSPNWSTWKLNKSKMQRRSPKLRIAFQKYLRLLSVMTPRIRSFLEVRVSLSQTCSFIWEWLSNASTNCCKRMHTSRPRITIHCMITQPASTKCTANLIMKTITNTRKYTRKFKNSRNR